MSQREERKVMGIETHSVIIFISCAIETQYKCAGLPLYLAIGGDQSRCGRGRISGHCRGVAETGTADSR